MDQVRANGRLYYQCEDCGRLLPCLQEVDQHEIEGCEMAARKKKKQAAATPKTQKSAPVKKTDQSETRKKAGQWIDTLARNVNK